MDDNLVLELRNKSALENNQVGTGQGEWTTNLQEAITIEEGDAIIARNVFVDTKAITSPRTKIPVPNTLRINMEFMLYNMNWTGAAVTSPAPVSSAATSSIKALNEVAGTHVAKNDGKLYVACTKTDASGTGKVLKSISSITAVCVYTFGDDPAPYNLVAVYRNEDGNIATTTITVPELDPGLFGNTSYTLNVRNLVYEVGGAPIPLDQFPNGAGKVQNSDVAVYVNKGTTDPIGPNGEPIGKFLDGVPDVRFEQSNLQRGNIPVPGDTTPTGPANNLCFFNVRIEKLPAGNEVPLINYRPKLFNFSFELEGGENIAYDPTELAQLINRELTKIDPGTITDSNLTGSNPFLQHVGKGQPAANAAFNNFIEMRFVGDSEFGGTDETYGFEYNTTSTNDEGRKWVGASQVELAFNPDSRKFSFDFMHMPVFTSNTGAVGISRSQQFPAAGFLTYQVSRNGGCCFTKLQAERVDGRGVVPFFEETLGFGQAIPGKQGARSLDHMLVSYTIGGNIPGPTGGHGGGNIPNVKVNGVDSGIPIFNRPISVGVDATAGFQGIDSVVEKGALGSSTSFNTPVSLPIVTGTAPNQTTVNNVLATSDKTEPIEAPTSVLNASNNITFAYFLAEVQAQFGTRLINPEQSHNNRVAIVSRYYEENSYTSSSSDSAIVYQHKSKVPILINSFKCRILDSDGNLANNIGTDNTIFLEIARAPKQPPAILEAELKEQEQERKVGMKEK